MYNPIARSERSKGLRRGRRIDWLFLLLFSVTLIAFAAVSTRYLGVVFNHLTRYVVLVLLLLFLLLRNYFGRGLSGAFGLWIVFYLSWVCATIIWSQVPNLSAAKAVLQVIVTVAFLSAGYAWTSKSPPEHAFSAFAGMTLLVGVTGILGAGIAEAALDTGSVILYRGLAYNPNLLGVLVLMSLPWTLWYLHSNHRAASVQRRAMAYVAGIAVVGVLLLTGARSSILGVAVAGVVYLYYAGLGRYAVTLGLAILASTIALMLSPDIFDGLWSIIAKGTEEGGDLFFSRRQVWEDSWAGAQEGGLVGLGFGVSAGFTDFAGGLSAEGYGREKGNTILAILEELGQVGLFLYAMLILSFFAKLMSAAVRVRRSDIRAQLGLVMGTTIGLIVNSQFEAWFVAPAAPASPFFWSLLGCGIALAHRAEALVQTQGADSSRNRAAQRVQSVDRIHPARR